jgi:hypothetical protein
MSFTVNLSSANIIAVANYDGTTGKDVMWGFNFNIVQDGAYRLTWSGQTLNLVQATFLTNYAVLMDIGCMGNNYNGSDLTIASVSQEIGIFKNNIITATIANLDCMTTDNCPVYFKNINKSANFIRLKFVNPGSTTLTSGTALPAFSITLNFEKISDSLV